jgi:hypothetical protein
VDTSVSKPASTPAKSKVQPIPFNQYNSNIPQSEAFEDVLARSKSDLNVDAGDRATPILLSEDDSPPSQPDVDKIHKMARDDCAEMGWESPHGWDFDNETIAACIAKLKKKRDGKVENPSVSPSQAMASPPASRVVPSKASTPASGSHRSNRIMGSNAEPVLQKAICATALKNTPGTAPSDAFVSFRVVSDSLFLEVASDSSLVFDSSFSFRRQVISLVRAKEIAQALLAEAIFKSNSVQQEEANPVVVEPRASSIASVQSAGVLEPSQIDSTLLAQWKVCQQK